MQNQIHAIDLAGIPIGPNCPPVVFAEIGINHGGSLQAAIDIAGSAISAGAKFIKHQTHIPVAEMSKEAENTIPGNADKSIFEVISENSLTLEEEAELAGFIRENEGIYFSTPFSREAVDFLVDLKVPFFKIGSGECNNYPFVDYVASQGKPIVLSTGMNSVETIDEAVRIIESHGLQYALLHTTNLYPTPSSLLRLGGMTELEKTFNVPVGLSDHSTNNAACIAAVGLGASILERHFVDDRNSRVGPDVVCSMDSSELRELIVWSNQIFQARGGSKYLAEEEKVTANFAFASVASIRKIMAGEKLTIENCFPIRPGTGPFSPSDYKDILGAEVLCEIPARIQINPSMIRL